MSGDETDVQNQVAERADVPKPPEVLAMAAATAGLFDMLRRWFEVGSTLTADLSAVHSASIDAELQDPQMVVRFTMRRLQALHLVAREGQRTTTDVILIHIDSVLRSLIETPSRHLRREGADVDWDREWAVLDAGMLLADRCPAEEAAEFRRFVDDLMRARHAVIEASGDRIRVLS